MSEQRHATEDEFPDQNPSDKSFGAEAAEKAEALDQAEGDAEQLRDEPVDAQPRAAGKAEPS